MKGQKIAIIGGGAVGLDVMELFTERGAEVTMVEMLPMIGNGLALVTIIYKISFKIINL